MQFAPQYGVGEAGIAAVALAVFIGHLFPVFFKFQGGKGVATALGVLLAIHVWLGLAVLATWLLATAIWRTSSLSALIAATAAPAIGFWLLGFNAYSLVLIPLCALLIWRHQSNIRNLLAGREASIGKPNGRNPPP